MVESYQALTDKKLNIGIVGKQFEQRKDLNCLKLDPQNTGLPIRRAPSDVRIRSTTAGSQKDSQVQNAIFQKTQNYTNQIQVNNLNVQVTDSTVTALCERSDSNEQQNRSKTNNFDYQPVLKQNGQCHFNKVLKNAQRENGSLDQQPMIMSPKIMNMPLKQPVKMEKVDPKEQKSSLRKQTQAQKTKTKSASLNQGKKPAAENCEDPNYDLEAQNYHEQPDVFDVPRDLQITNSEMSDRKCLDVRRWHCLARPQHPRTCGISSLTSCWNYLFSTLGALGTHRPISVEEALEVCGFLPPYEDVAFGRFTGNDKLMEWFHLLNDHFGVEGEAKISFKLHGPGATQGISSEKARHELQEGLQSKTNAYIYHCFNHYMCPIGYENTPIKAYEAFTHDIKEMKGGAEPWIIIGDPAKCYPCFHVKKWDDIYIDINAKMPQFYNIRKTEEGIQTKEGARKTGHNNHCIIQFSRKELPKQRQSDAEFLNTHFGDNLTKALAEVAKQRPSNPVEYLCEMLKNLKC